MRGRRRHVVSRGVGRGASLARAFVPLGCGLFVVALSGSQCLHDNEEREACEEVCAKEDECGLRPLEACLAELCALDGYRVVVDPATAPDGGVVEDAGPGAEHDLASLSSNDCERAAQDCAELALCSCESSCDRVDECTGDPDPTCVDTCEVLLEQSPEASFAENRCRMESTCADLPACSSSQ